jgi:predicted DNA-binding transcriptional regulator YafY
MAHALAQGSSQQVEPVTPHGSESGAATIIYTNYRGETSVRHVLPGRIWFGESDWHDGEQWFLEAFDVEKNGERSFALKDVRCWI